MLTISTRVISRLWMILGGLLFPDFQAKLFSDKTQLMYIDSTSSTQLCLAPSDCALRLSRTRVWVWQTMELWSISVEITPALFLVNSNHP